MLPALRRALFPATLAIAITATLTPLWCTQHLPAVDAPQHLFLAHVLRALQDPASSYHEIYESGLRFTYVSFYGGTALLAAWLGEEAALRIWLSLVLAAVPLAVLALLRAFGRNPWLALLACPLVYTDGFYWGLFSFQSALALSLASLAWCARALQQPAEERRWAFLFGLAAVLLVLTHVAALALPVLGGAFLFLVTPSDGRKRQRALLALLPALVLLALWLFVGAQGIPENLGKHWSGTGSLLDTANYAFTPIAARAKGLIGLLANGFWGHADLAPVLAWLGLVALALVLALRQGRARAEPVARDLRPVGLLALALACYFSLPTDVSGYVYMLHGRYAQLSALCAIPAIPRLGGRAGACLAALATALALASGIQLTLLFRRFDREAQPFEAIAARLPMGSKVMHLVVEEGSRVATHAVYLHYTALAALRCNGVPSFSFAHHPSFLVNYRPGARPPGPKWEWRPARFSWDAHARFYDYYLVRGAAPSELFGEHAGDVQVVAREGSWTLLRRRPP